MVRRTSQTRQGQVASGALIRSVRLESALGTIAFACADGVLLELTFGRGACQKLQSLAAAAGCRLLPDNDAWPDLSERLAHYASGEMENFADVPVDLSDLSRFERKVIEICRQIPFGRTITYGRLAELSGAPRAARAVGNVMATNRYPLVIPCHRVTLASGRASNYSAGSYASESAVAEGRRLKLRLLEQEESATGNLLVLAGDE